MSESVMRSQLFEFAIIFNPTKDEAKEGKEPEVVVHPTTILAQGKDDAFLKAAWQVPETYRARAKQLDICLRPF